MEVLKVPLEKKKKEDEKLGDEYDLCLELSIGGGRYAKSDNSRGKNHTESSHGGRNDNSNSSGAVLRSDFSGDDLRRRREIQAVRRQEARRKREEKLRKSRGQNGNFAFVEDRLFLEAQRLQARVLEREVREREEVVRKGEKNELHLCLYPKVQHVVAWGQNVGLDCESEEQSNAGNEGGNRKTASFERSSSPVSDYQSTSQKGGNISDTGSHSSPSHAGWYQNFPAQSKYEPESNGSSSQTEPFTRNSNPNPHFNNICLASSNPATPPGTGPTDRPPKPPNHNDLDINAAPPVPHMPRVTATGNGPNGRTVTGFLYKYTKAEVSIVCVCHGTSFSPAEFVEHAGGVDVSHPLRHITIVPAAFG